MEQRQAEGGVPGDVVGGGSEWDGGIGMEAVDRDCGIVDGRQAGGQAGPSCVVAILVPPPILQEVQTVFQPPMVTDMLQKFRRCDALGIEAGDEITHIVREHGAVGGTNCPIDAQR